MCDKFNGNDDMSSSIKDNIKRLDVILALKDLWEGYTYESTYLDEDNEEQIEGRHALQDIAEALRAIADCVDTDTRDLLQSYIYSIYASVSASFFSNSSILFIASSSVVGFAF